MSEITLVETYAEAVNNIESFNRKLSSSISMQNCLTSFLNWYYAPELEAMAPSMFAAYKGLSIQLYIELCYSSRAINEEVSIKRLAHWFHPVNNLERDMMQSRLRIFASYYDKRPNKLAVIYIPINTVSLTQSPGYIN